MAMEGVRSSLATLLFLTFALLAASASGGGGDDAAAAAVEVEERHPLAADESYRLVAFHNKDGEEIRLLSDKGSKTVSASGFANRSGHWFYAIRDDGNKGVVVGKRRVRLPHQSISSMSRGSRVEGLWNTLGVLANTSGPVAAAADGDERYVLIGMETSGGHKIRLLLVADQRYFFITGLAQGFFWQPNWFFRDGERHRLVTTLGGNGNESSHAEVVASNVLAAMMKDGEACCG